MENYSDKIRVLIIHTKPIILSANGTQLKFINQQMIFSDWLMIKNQSGPLILFARTIIAFAMRLNDIWLTMEALDQLKADRC